MSGTRQTSNDGNASWKNCTTPPASTSPWPRPAGDGEDPQGAIADADWLIAHWPRAAPFAEHERSLCFAQLQQPENALAAWAKALVVNAGLHEQSSLDPFVTALTESAPDDPRVADLALRHWRKRGKAAPRTSDR